MEKILEGVAMRDVCRKVFRQVWEEEGFGGGGKIAAKDATDAKMFDWKSSFQ